MRGLYLFAIVLMVMPLADLVSTVLPARPGDFSWRYGTLGLAAGYLHTPMIGLALALGLGFWREHPWVLRFGGAVAMVGSVALGLVIVVFALDVLQMRGMREEEVQSAVLAGGVLQEIKYLTAALVLAPLGYGAWRTAGAIKRSSASRASGAPGIVTRSGKAPT
ncbi:MAG: hypothetical protein U5R14_02650 [Gemmatimonadota bacterium]|nr:hypothetical protein [Gemmatimonadota bacterium]